LYGRQIYWERSIANNGFGRPRLDRDNIASLKA
jgi:hypothetical protein